MLNRRTTAALAATITAVPLIGLGVVGTSMASASSPVAARSSASTTVQASSHRTTVLITNGGVTMLKLDAGTAKALTSHGVSVKPASEARPGASGIVFPIRGGSVQASNLHGYITHDGGLTFTAGGKSLTIRDFTVATAQGTLNAYVDEVGARITVLNLSLAHAKVSAGHGTLGVTNVKATLNAGAAKALDGYFGTTLFTPGLAIGTVRISAETTSVTK